MLHLNLIHTLKVMGHYKYLGFPLWVPFSGQVFIVKRCQAALHYPQLACKDLLKQNKNRLIQVTKTKQKKSDEIKLAVQMQKDTVNRSVNLVRSLSCSVTLSFHRLSVFFHSE